MVQEKKQYAREERDMGPPACSSAQLPCSKAAGRGWRVVNECINAFYKDGTKKQKKRSYFSVIFFGICTTYR